MSPWPGKYVIGLTGNIAAGKSVVRLMLEHLGAYGIDADALARRALAPGAPGFQPAVDYFGKYILDSSGQVNRARLGRLVFSDPEALAKLESIVHPLVRQGINAFVRRTKKRVVVIEAIKLLEGDLHESCDTIWVAHASANARLQRLVEKRGMGELEARQRIAAQGNPNDKLAAANVVIRNDRSFEHTWKQVAEAWQQNFPAEDTGPVQITAEGDELVVQRARPSQAEQIAQLVQHLTGGSRKMTRGDVMAEFGEKAFLLLFKGERPVGLLGWQVENLVTRTTDFYLEKGIPLSAAAEQLVRQVEAASSELQSEASLLFLPKEFSNQDPVWKNLGYARRSIDSLNVRAWQEAARESAVPGSQMLFKQLRVDRVLRPI